MPETPIDQAPNLTSVRLKIPTGTVPIPPSGYGQLHEPSSGVLALRLPDGSVVVVGPSGGGGGGGGDTITGTGGSVDAVDGGDGFGVKLLPGSGLGIKLGGPFADQFNNLLRAVRAGVESTGGTVEWDGSAGAYVPGRLFVPPQITVSSAELLALHTTPKVLVPAQGVGRLIWPLLLSFRLNFATTPYVVPDVDPGIGWMRGPIDFDRLAPFNQLDANADVRQDYAPVNWDTGAAVADENTPLVLFNQGSAFTDGDGTLTITVVWVLV